LFSSPATLLVRWPAVVGVRDVPMEGHEGNHANKLPKPKDAKELLHVRRKHQEGQQPFT